MPTLDSREKNVTNIPRHVTEEDRWSGTEQILHDAMKTVLVVEVVKDKYIAKQGSQSRS